MTEIKNNHPDRNQGGKMSRDSDRHVKELGRRFAEAQQQADTSALDSLLTDDFRVVGPLGFVLDKETWLEQFRSGALVMRSVEWDDVAVCDYGDAAIAIGRQTQQAEYNGQPAPGGQFRVTQVAVLHNGKWVLAGLHFSGIAQGA
jgi:ketosteroid isomerase-like protein